MDEETSYGLVGGCGSVNRQAIEDPVTHNCLPLGKPIGTGLPPELIGDVLEAWNFFSRFHRLLDLQEGSSFHNLTEELIGSLVEGQNKLCTFKRQCPEIEKSLSYNAKSCQKVLSKAYTSMLKLLISELWQSTIDMPAINELTWPEMAHRYAMAVSESGDLDSAEVTVCRSTKVFRCLCGDGGLLCGSLSGVAGIEADAKVLAMAIKEIFGSWEGENDYLVIDDANSDEKGLFQKLSESEGFPRWAKELEDVKEMPTNVGSKIRKCVYAALRRGPPDWAKRKLEYSISKEIYKGNASGRTKRIVLSVLEDVRGEVMRKKSANGKGRTNFVSFSDIIMKQCRIVFRRTIVADKKKVFCNLLGGRVENRDNSGKGFLGSPGMVSRPLDFRTIDMRLAIGSYGGSHEAFLEDIQELWNNVRIAYANQPNMLQLSQSLSRNFVELYDKEVDVVYKKLKSYIKLESLSADLVEEIRKFLESINNIPGAPWDKGICKVCGIDRDDNKVLLCDKCDDEYHTYCLNSPIASIPKGSWYCPGCVASNDNKAESEQLDPNTTPHLLTMMKEKEYGMLCPHEKTLLLKFFCEQLLNSDSVRTEVKIGSLRNEFLGSDSAERYYWIMEFGDHPEIVVAERSKSQQDKDRCPIIIRGKSSENIPCFTWTRYQSSAEIKSLIEFLKDNDPIERQLKESISQWHELRFQEPQTFESHNHNELQQQNNLSLSCLITKAAISLENKYGPFVGMETIDLGKKKVTMVEAIDGCIYRCECLEPIPAGQHCLSCHKTFLTERDLKVHSKGGCIAILAEKGKMTSSVNTCISPNSLKGGNECGELQRVDGPEVERVNCEDKNLQLQNAAAAVGGGTWCDLPASSLKPVTGESCDILRKLKINLLDMDTAIPQEALRLSKARFERRCTWRAYVKCASTICEMVLASIAFEDMIKAEYLDRKWWYWSSLTAAAKISTWSSLSLRIYSLDMAINYEKPPPVLNSLKHEGKLKGVKWQYDPASSGKQDTSLKKKGKEPCVSS